MRVIGKQGNGPLAFRFRGLGNKPLRPTSDVSRARTHDSGHVLGARSCSRSSGTGRAMGASFANIVLRIHDKGALAIHTTQSPRSPGTKGEFDMTTAQRSTVVGVFEDRRNADRAVGQLLKAGFRQDQIGVAMRHTDDSRMW